MPPPIPLSKPQPFLLNDILFGEQNLKGRLQSLKSNVINDFLWRAICTQGFQVCVSISQTVWRHQGSEATCCSRRTTSVEIKLAHLVLTLGRTMKRYILLLSSQPSYSITRAIANYHRWLQAERTNRGGFRDLCIYNESSAQPGLAWGNHIN